MGIKLPFLKDKIMHKNNFEGIRIFIFTAKKECLANQVDCLEKSISDLHDRLLYAIRNMLKTYSNSEISNDEQEMSIFVAYSLIFYLKDFFAGREKLSISKENILNILDICFSIMKEPYKYLPSSFLDEACEKLILDSNGKKSFI